MASPPVFKVPAAPAKKTQLSQQAIFRAYINKHPGLKPWAQGIYKNAHDYGIDPVYFASLVNSESGGNENAVSPKGAIGLGQVMPLHVGEPVPWAPGQRVTLEDLKNPGFNLRWSAAFFAQKVSAAGGNYDEAYRGQGGYNPGGPQIFQDVPGKYVPTTTASSPTQVAQRGAETKVATAVLTPTTWAVLKGGKLRFITTKSGPDGAPKPPHGTLRIFDTPLTKSDFLQQHAGIQDDYLAYTGRRPSFNETASVLAHGWSQYQLRQHLTSTPGFFNSPVWKQNAPGYEDVFKQIYGADVKPDKEAVKYAITNNLGSSGFATYLREQPNYKKSNEFVSNYAGNENVFAQIYGSPNTPEAHQAIEQATMHGWDQNTFAKYLRSQPNYTSSPEYLSKATAFLDAMGLVFGGTQAVLKPGTNPQQTGGQGDLPPTLGLVPGFG